MSLVPTWAACDDGLFHKDPTLSDRPDGDWFICFDDDDPPELVVVGKHDERTMREILKDNGIDAAIITEVVQGVGRAKLPFDKHIYPTSSSAFLEILSPPPAKLVISERGEPCKREDIRGECVIEMCGWQDG